MINKQALKENGSIYIHGLGFIPLARWGNSCTDNFAGWTDFIPNLKYFVLKYLKPLKRTFENFVSLFLIVKLNTKIIKDDEIKKYTMRCIST